MPHFQQPITVSWNPLLFYEMVELLRVCWQNKNIRKLFALRYVSGHRCLHDCLLSAEFSPICYGPEVQLC